MSHLSLGESFWLIYMRPRYYEGKEFETQLKEKRPGDLSPELVEALSIPPLAPPPWLISMQRFGPPPSYPTLRIPGLNAPIPEGYVEFHSLVHCGSLHTKCTVGFPSRWMGEATIGRIQSSIVW